MTLEEIQERSLRKQTECEKKFLDALKVGGKYYKELEKIIPKKTLSRYIKRFIVLGIIFQSEDQRYYWHEFKTKAYTEEHIEHNKYVIDGLDLLMEDFDYLICSPPTKIGPVKEGYNNVLKSENEIVTIAEGMPLEMYIHTKLLKLRHDTNNASKIKCAKDHLKTGYPDVYKIFEECENFGKSGYVGKIPKLYLDKISRNKTPFFNDFFESHAKLASKVGVIKAKYNYEKILYGQCSICMPKKEVKK